MRSREHAPSGDAARPSVRVKTLLAQLRSEAHTRRDQGLDRVLHGPAGIDFSSNDYLGLAADIAFRKRVLDRLGEGPLTAPSSRLLRGQTERHRQLEERQARLDEHRARDEKARKESEKKNKPYY